MGVFFMEHIFQLHWGLHALLKVLRDCSFETVLDVGSGTGEHARFFQLFGKKVSTCNLFSPADWVGDFLDAPIEGEFDLIWCSHALEHQRNPGLFLDKMYRLLRPGGTLALCLPHHPAARLVPGHLSVWSLALACQHLVYAGFDCRNVSSFSSYELSVIVQKTDRGPKRASTEPSWEEVKAYLPECLEVGSEAEPSVLNWDNVFYYPLTGAFFEGEIKIESKNLNLYPSLRPSFV
jgi:SAM-dependent methyltransferase